jgi:GxxExxY protein
MTLVTTPIVTALIGCAIRVHKALGPGLFESVYEPCLAHELTQDGLPFRQQVPIGLTYGGQSFECAFRADFIVANEVLIEIKAVEALTPRHEAQVRTYLRCTGLNKGLLLNFSTPTLKIKSIVMSATPITRDARPLVEEAL